MALLAGFYENSRIENPESREISTLPTLAG
jgi:hypothetical protein